MLVGNIMIMVILVATLVAESTTESLTPKQENVEKHNFELESSVAKSVLVRHKRAFVGSIWRWITGEGDSEESRREGNRRRQQAQAERAREVRLDRICPSKCWNPWPSTWSPCTQPCGGLGTQTQTRTLRSADELGECKGYKKCEGSNTRVRECNRFCQNGGSLYFFDCHCSTGWRGQCCETRITCRGCVSLRNGTVHPTGCVHPYGTVVKFSCDTGYRLSGDARRTCTATGTWSTPRVPTCTRISCGSLQPPSSGRLVALTGTTDYGASVKATCNRGYRLEGSSVRQCRSNYRWSGTAPSCKRIVCSPVSQPQNGRVMYHPTLQRYLDAEVKYICNRGYVIQGHNIRRCQTNSQWTTSTPRCTAIMCRSLSTRLNIGRIVYSQNSGGLIPYGETASFYCNSGYVLEGQARLTCGGNSEIGRFVGSLPTCRRILCTALGNLVNGVQYGSLLAPGSVVTFRCLAGFYLIGEDRITCLQGGRWSDNKPSCKICPINTYKSGTNNAKSCKPCPRNSATGSLAGATSVSFCRCRLGFTSNRVGSCALIRCPALRIPQNGRLIGSCGNTVGSTCVFACHAGHVISEGDTIRKCTDLAIWSGADITCQACPKDTYRSNPTTCLPCPPKSRTTGTGKEKEGCHCVTGYAGPRGGPCSDIDECSLNNGGCQQTCLNNDGSFSCRCTLPGWVEDEDDLKKCTAKNNCSDMPAPENGGVVCYDQRRTNTKSCQVKCNNGFEHLDEHTNAYETCGPSTNWKWSYQGNQTKALECFPAFFEGIQSNADVFYFAGNCSDIDGIQRGNIAEEFVSFLGKQGVCQHSFNKTCSIENVEIRCHQNSPSRTRPSDDPNLNFRFSINSIEQQTPTTYDCGKSCRKEIENKLKDMISTESKKVVEIYQKTDATTPKITLGGVEMKQSSKISVSPPVAKCGKGKVSKNGMCLSVFCDVPTSLVAKMTKVMYGDTVKVNCPAAKTLIGNDVLYCDKDGQFSTELPRCEVTTTPISLQCPRLPGLPDGKIETSGYSFGDVAAFSCNANYQLIGDRSTQCGARGQWYSYTVYCALTTTAIMVQCPPLPHLLHGRIATTGRGNGDQALFYCHQNYELVGDRRTSCGPRGRWNPYSASCVHYRNLEYDCQYKNPCSPLRLPGRSYYRHRNPRKFVDCTRASCLERYCPGYMYWDNYHLQCMRVRQPSTQVPQVRRTTAHVPVASTTPYAFSFTWRG